MGSHVAPGIETSRSKLSGGLDSPDSRWVIRMRQFGRPAAAALLFSADPATAIPGAHAASCVWLPAGTPAIVAACAAANCPLVLGTTGHSAEQLAAIDAAAKQIPIVMASNFSLGVNLLFKLAELAAKSLNADYDIEIFEAHHKHKKDAPSGTALSLGESAAKGRGTTLADDGVYARHGETGARERGTIGFSVLRGGDIIGDHTVTFAVSGRSESINASRARSHELRQGALQARRWAIAQGAWKVFDADVLPEDGTLAKRRGTRTAALSFEFRVSCPETRRK